MKRFVLLVVFVGIFSCFVFSQEKKLPEFRLDSIPKLPSQEYPYTDTLRSFPKDSFNFRTIPRELQKKLAASRDFSKKKQYNAWPDNMPVVVPESGGSLFIAKPDSSYQYHIRKFGENRRQQKR